MSFLKQVFRLYYYGSLHVALATGVCATAFFKLPSGENAISWIALSQIILTCWLIYILDRLLDVIKAENPPLTKRHQYHFNHQYNLQILAVALLAINIFLVFLEPKTLLIYGTIISLLVLAYLKIIVPKYPLSKDFFMPLIYTSAVVGVPFVLASSINLSSWFLAIIFLCLVYQNLLGFTYFETQNQRKRKAVNYLTALNIVLFILFFQGSFEYVNRLALIFLIISLAYSFISSNYDLFKDKYRWIMDSLLFLPLVLFLF